MKYFFPLQMLILLLVCPQYSIAQKAENNSITSVLWVQRSAEYRALCYQTYNLAELRVREYLANPDQTKPAAVIFDIDETLLDNSPSEARDIIEGQTYSADKWKAWTDLSSAAAVPGSLDFCHFLAQHGIQLFYVTNRTGAESTATLLNLQKWDFPYSDRNHLFCKSQTSSKESRRNVVENQYNVILLVGDNLADFDVIFEDRAVNFGFNAVDSLRKEFGKKFIVLPNPIYGDWTKPLTGDPQSWLKTDTGDKL